jgi:tetratricopeptide (TPR) repeat protein
MQNNNNPSENPDTLRKQGNFQEAAVLYSQLFQTSQSPYHLHWQINCLRKSGRLEQAYTLAQKGLQQFPQDKYIRSEMGWIIYDRELKPAKESGNFGMAIAATKRALEINPDNELLLNKSVQLLMKIAKASNNPDWKTVALFAEKINPETLSDQKRSTTDGKQYISEKEEWFINIAHAFLKIDDFPKAIKIARNALNFFPNEIFLIRTIALAQFRAGDAKSGAETMRQLLNHPRCDWYIRGELAEMEMSLNNDEEAYRLLCQALLNRQDDQYKLGYFELFATLALKMKKPEFAQLTLALARTVRSTAGWNVPPSLTALEGKTAQAFQSIRKPIPTLTQTQEDLTRECNKIWKDGASEGLKRFRGRVKQILPDRKYTFIQPETGEESPIVFMRDLPRDCAIEGTPVEYSLEKSFDTKKNRESYKAVNIRKISIDN